MLVSRRNALMRFAFYRRTTTFLASLSLLGLATLGAEPNDWPQWRGEQRDGQSSAEGLLTEWPSGGPRLLWTVKGLGAGYSSLSISGGRIFSLGDIGGAQYLIARNLDDGRELWKTRFGPAWSDRYGGPRSTPTVSGNRVYGLGTDSDLICADIADGRIVWRKNLKSDFGGFMSTIWKFSESPLIDGDKVIVTPGANSAALVALDKSSGREIWRTRIPDLGPKGKDGAAYSSVVVSRAAGVRQYVQLLGKGVIGVDTETGRFLWGYNRVANDVANIATPIIDGDYVFSSTGYGTGSALIKIERNPEGNLEAREVYFLEGRTLQNHHGGLILHQGYLYTGTGHNKGFPVCVKLESGEVAWGPERNKGGGSAAISYADGHLYFRYQNGVMMLIEATPEGYREKGSFTIPNVAQFSWSHPVISEGRLYLREQDELHCYDISAN